MLMAATTTGVMDMALCGSMTTVQGAVDIGTTSGDFLLSHQDGLYQIFLRHKIEKDPDLLTF